jgi:hypothetical protein
MPAATRGALEHDRAHAALRGPPCDGEADGASADDGHVK